MTDDKEDKTLEHQEHFTEVAKSRDVEVSTVQFDANSYKTVPVSVLALFPLSALVLYPLLYGEHLFHKNCP
jgi:hypothetical protein